jgi:hypothetical protein
MLFDLILKMVIDLRVDMNEMKCFAFFKNRNLELLLVCRVHFQFSGSLSLHTNLLHNLESFKV